MGGELDGLRVLVVEDRAAVAMALCDRLEDSGATVVGPAARLPEATELAEGGRLDVAILDVDLDGVFSYPLARKLRERNVPVVLMTGYDFTTLPADMRELPRYDKLGSFRELTRLLVDAVRG